MSLLSKTEKAYLSGNHDFSKTKQRYVRYRLKRKLLLIDEERRDVAAKLLRCNAIIEPNRPSQAVALSDIHAPRSGGEQRKQDPCRKAYGITSHRAWQTASSG